MQGSLSGLASGEVDFMGKILLLRRLGYPRLQTIPAVGGLFWPWKYPGPGEDGRKVKTEPARAGDKTVRDVPPYFQLEIRE